MKRLPLSATLSLPLDACTQTFAWLGRKGVGKTYGSGKFVELLLTAGVQVVILDTVGNWYGLRLGADGKSPGFEIPVFGGLRKDLPLLATAGALVADVICETGRSAILDVSQFNFADRKRFAADFGMRLWQRKKSETAPAPLHLVIEECQLIVPQFVGKDETRMVHVYEEIIRLGRNYGIGVSMLTQRPQSVNKEALTQAECILAFQINGVPERKALKEWLTYEGADVNLVNELPSLPVGTCYLWSPQWLRHFEKVTIAPKQTFDASATPKIGHTVTRRDPTPLNVADIEQRMAATIEQAKADDPKALRAELARLTRELEQTKRASAAASPPREVPIISDTQLAEFQALCHRAGQLTEQWEHVGQDISRASSLILEGLYATQRMLTHKRAQAVVPARLAPTEGVRPPTSGATAPGTDSSSLPKMARTMLTVLAQHPQGLTKSQILVHAEYRASGPVSKTFAWLLAQGWVMPSGGKLVISDSGLTTLGPYEPLPVGRALLLYLLTDSPKLSLMERRLLDAIAQAYPASVSKGRVLEQTGYAASGPISKAFAKLVACQYVVPSGRAELRLAEELA